MTDEELELFPTSESAAKMLSYVTQGFYDKSYVGKWIFQVIGLEYDDMQTLVEELPDQMFPETATWGLKYHEIKWGLPIRENLSYEERRKLIYQKRDCRAPMTPYQMENYLKNSFGVEVSVADVSDPGDYGFSASHPNVFKVYMVLYEDTADLDSDAAMAMIDKLKQSHTVYVLNERTELFFHNEDLEQIRLKNITFLAGIFYQSRFGVLAGVLNALGAIQNDTEDVLKNVRFSWKQETALSAAMRMVIRLAVSAWCPFCFDGSWLLDGSYLLDGRRGNVRTAVTFRTGITSTDLETADNISITTKTRDYWFLDGSYLLDGSKNLDSIYRKEVAE